MRVALADDSVLFREGVAQLLEGSGFQVVGRAGDGAELLAMVESKRPDIAITDIRMPPTHTIEGLEAAVQIRERHPAVAVLLLSQYVETTHALRLLAKGAGGLGYLLKDRVSDVREFVNAVRRIAVGVPQSTLTSSLSWSSAGGAVTWSATSPSGSGRC